VQTIVDIVVHVLLAFALSPLLMGVIARTKAVFAGRNGPPLVQPYRDILRLFRKGTVLSRTTTWMFLAGPVVGVVTVAIASLLIPLAGSVAPIAFPGDFLAFVYLLALSRFFTASAALDTGSPFEGMGAAREVTYACLAEPAFFLGLLVLAKLAGSLQLSGMLGSGLALHWSTAGASLALVLISWFVVLLAENCRIPFDDPNTHLELTMIHEVMVLDHSGPGLGMILYGAALKLFILGALLVRLAFPVVSGSPWLDWPIFVVEMLLVAMAVGIVESTMARLRLTYIPVLLVAASLFSGFGILLLVR
jgi:formate hydrogenlyase subunit 4